VGGKVKSNNTFRVLQPILSIKPDATLFKPFLYEQGFFEEIKPFRSHPIFSLAEEIETGN